MKDMEKFIHYTVLGIEKEYTRKTQEIIKNLLNSIIIDLKRVETVNDVYRIISNLERVAKFYELR